MSTIRDRAREAADRWERHLLQAFCVPTSPERRAFVDGYLAAHADLPTRAAIARALADADQQPGISDAQTLHHYGEYADAVLDRIKGAGQ